MQDWGLQYQGGDSLLGDVTVPPFPPHPQVAGRGMVLFVVLASNEKLHQHPVVWVLFLVWSLIELVRYDSWL